MHWPGQHWRPTNRSPARSSSSRHSPWKAGLRNVDTLPIINITKAVSSTIPENPGKLFLNLLLLGLGSGVVSWRRGARRRSCRCQRPRHAVVCHELIHLDSFRSWEKKIPAGSQLFVERLCNLGGRGEELRPAQARFAPGSRYCALTLGSKG